ncbi:MAG: hypothetical protein ABW321_26800 [Polyangiales bacterium]
MRVAPYFVVVATALAGCSEDLGTCDMTLATQLVYAPNGTPYYAGQGLVEFGCAQGVCHSSIAQNAGRNGAPHGLNFDLVPIASGGTPDDITRLRDGVEVVRGWSGDIYGEIRAGTMPPGEAGASRLNPIAWKLPNNSDANLPGLNSDVGQATVRNWLACGSPIVARQTGAPAEAATIVGDEKPPLTLMPAGDTFQDVYDSALASCGTSCHAPGGTYSLLDLSTPAVAYAAIVGKPGPGTCAGAGPLVVAGDCQSSTLYKKLLPSPPCGAQMPLGMPVLQSGVVDALCKWIDAGAKQQ